MKNLVVGFSRPKGWFKPFSWAIRAFDWTPYSHVYVELYLEEEDRKVIYQASSLCVNFMAHDRFDSEEVICREFSIPVSDEKYLSIVQFAIDNAGAPYDLLSVFGLVAVRAAGVFGKKIANPAGSRPGMFFCSKLGDAILELAGESDGIPPSLETPKEIYNYLDALQKKP